MKTTFEKQVMGARCSMVRKGLTLQSPAVQALLGVLIGAALEIPGNHDYNCGCMPCRAWLMLKRAAPDSKL